MFGVDDSTEQGRPWFYLGRLPVHSATLLVLIFSASMVVVTLLIAFRLTGAVGGLALSREAVVGQGRVWQLVTWPLVNGPSLGFVISMVLLYWFGREVEKLLGRVSFLKFVGWLAVALVAVTLLVPSGFLAGSSDLGFGVFLAFAIIYPSAIIWCLFNLSAKWWALILIGIYTLMGLAQHDWSGLAQLAATCAATAVILKLMGAAHSLPWLQWPAVTIRRRGAGPAALASARGGTTRALPGPQAEIDRLLDKVAAHGLHSLTDRERQLLAAASDQLQRRKG